MAKEVDPFNQYVHEKEYDDYDALMIDVANAKRSAEGCGCHQCRKVFERLQAEEYEEAWRLSYGSDHEEDWIAAQAIALLEDKSGTKNKKK